MYTILWTEDGEDRWERLEHKDEVLELLNKLSQNDGVCYDNIWIFGPKADDYASTPDTF
jgi:hypothetical protein